MRFNILQLLKNLRFHSHGKEITDADILEWANSKVRSLGGQSHMDSFKVLFLELLIYQSIYPSIPIFNLSFTIEVHSCLFGWVSNQRPALWKNLSNPICISFNWGPLLPIWLGFKSKAYFVEDLPTYSSIPICVYHSPLRSSLASLVGFQIQDLLGVYHKKDAFCS